MSVFTHIRVKSPKIGTFGTLGGTLKTEQRTAFKQVKSTVAENWYVWYVKIRYIYIERYKKLRTRMWKMSEACRVRKSKKTTYQTYQTYHIK